MSFVRAEARAQLWRWREVLAAIGLGVLGLWLALGRGLTVGLGYAALIAALVLLVVGIQRARFRLGGGGPGVVRFTEGQISYYGPLSGGVVALAEVTEIGFDPTGHPTHWLIDSRDAPRLHIPVTAEGAEVLFDAFTSLPGLRTEQMLAQMKAQSDRAVMVWRRDPVAVNRRLS